VDGQFVPALLMLVRALLRARPSVFKQGDITIDEALMRIEGTSTEAKERGKRFVESLASPQPPSTSGSRMFLVGYWSYEIEKDPVEAVKWYRMAAEQGNVDAQYDLGVCSQNGNGVAQDLDEAVKWYRMAAEHGDVEAQFILGWRSEYGQGVTKDPVEAVRWYRMAAEQGNTGGQYYLGACFENGIGVAKDLVEAVKWYRMAAEQGDADAREQLEHLTKSK
jgi:TPR repeat protein